MNKCCASQDGICRNVILWRKKVLERDKYICQMCGRPKSNIAHHKIRFRDCYDNENIAHNVSNGICLCKRCHKMVHGGGNYING